jgi:hypothetical protein
MIQPKGYTSSHDVQLDAPYVNMGYLRAVSFNQRPDSQQWFFRHQVTVDLKQLLRVQGCCLCREQGTVIRMDIRYFEDRSTVGHCL